MTASPEPMQDENTYVLDPESAAEMARLLNQDQLMTKGMGGIFPEEPDLSNVHNILDIGCGPGGWVLEVAREYPAIQVTGIDISKTMIEYARAHAKARDLDNATFLMMNALKPFDFPDNSFDLINARFVMGFIPKTSWPSFLQECLRILRPGGIFRFTEAEYGSSTSAACNKLMGITYILLQKAGYSFSPDGTSMGIAPVMPRLLREAGFQNIHKMPYAIEASAGTEAYAATADNFRVIYQVMQPILIKMGIITQGEIEQLYNTALIDLLSDDFCVMSFMLTVWGEKPW